MVKPADKVLQIRRNFILLVAVAREIKIQRELRQPKLNFALNAVMQSCYNIENCGGMSRKSDKGVHSHGNQRR